MTDKTVTDLTQLIRMMQSATEHHPEIFPAHPELAGKVKYYLVPPQIMERVTTQLKAERAEVERLREALSNVRLDICEAGVVVFRINPPCETTFDYIGRVLGDEVTWEEWEARAALKGE